MQEHVCTWMWKSRTIGGTFSTLTMVLRKHMNNISKRLISPMCLKTVASREAGTCHQKLSYQAMLDFIVNVSCCKSTQLHCYAWQPSPHLLPPSLESISLLRLAVLIAVNVTCCHCRMISQMSLAVGLSSGSWLRHALISWSISAGHSWGTLQSLRPPPDGCSCVTISQRMTP